MGFLQFSDLLDNQPQQRLQVVRGE
jgi:hypothetical protein